jgi:hypothetical protein
MYTIIIKIIIIIIFFKKIKNKKYYIIGHYTIHLFLIEWQKDKIFKWIYV